MSIELTPLNRLQLWRLVISEFKEWPELMKPPFGTGDRDKMIMAGLLEMVKEVPDPESYKKLLAARQATRKKRTDPAQGQPKDPKQKQAKTPKLVPINRVYLTHKGREYLLSHLGDPVSHKSPNSGPILSWLLATMGKAGLGKEALATVLGLGTKGAPLATGLGQGGEGASSAIDKPIPPKKGPALAPETLMKEIGFFPQNLFMPSGALKISTIKESLRGYSSMEIDAALLELEKRGHVVLYKFDDPSRVTPADRELGLRIGGAIRHYLFFR
ncbi:MAG: hypothetical protein LBU69_06945 [Deltaproteobacteria bacterium]|jgi:hypothetical protein|nr:hypothetical protein [Deltaproteobacteria bacterium]